jgi:hypothetical protein
VCRSPRTSASSSSRERLSPELALPELGRHERDPERAVDALLVRRLRERLERGDVLLRPCRPDELGAESLGLRDHQLDRNALDGHAQRPQGRPFDDRDDLREFLELCESRPRLRGRDDDREPLCRIHPASRVSGRDSAQGIGDPLHERPAPVQEERTSGRELRLSLQRREQLPLRLRPDPRHLA